MLYCLPSANLYQLMLFAVYLLYNIIII